MEPLLHRTGDEEEHPGDEAVGDHPHDRRVDSEVRERGDSQHHEAHVGNGREGDEALHVGLGEAPEGAVDDADDRQEADPGCPCHRSLRQDRDGDAHEAVGAQLQEHGSQDDRPDRGGLGVGVGQPGVEREHRHLDGEAQEHAAEDPELGGVRHPAGSHRVGEACEGERVCARQEEQGQEADQHECRAEQGEQEELQGCVAPVLAAPDGDHEEHREQHDLEEHEEEHQVLGHEGADHPRLEDQDQDQEGLRVDRIREVVPAVDDAQRHDQHGQQDERQGHAVDAHQVPAGDDVDPGLVHDELQLGCLAHVEPDEEQHAQERHPQGGHERDHLVLVLTLPGDEHHDRHTDQR